MNKILPLALVATFATMFVAPAALFAAETQPVQAATDASAPSVTAGKMLYGPNAKRIGSIYRVTADGAAQLILGGKIVTVPASTLSDVAGKITTSLSKADLQRSR